MRLDWLTDTWAVSAGDVAGTFASRGYSTITGRWETLPAIGLTPRTGSMPNHLLRAIYLEVLKATGGYRNGVRVWVAAHLDPQQNLFVVPLIDGVQRNSALLSWEGEAPLGAGIVWRIACGGIVATDKVGITVVYEKGAA